MRQHVTIIQSVPEERMAFNFAWDGILYLTIFGFEAFSWSKEGKNTRINYGCIEFDVLNEQLYLYK